MKNNLPEIIITLLLIVVAVLLENPSHFWMPDMLTMLVLLLLLVLFGILASFVLKEKSADERDAMHRALAGRNAFLFGSATLIIAIAIEGYRHAVDPWLVLALALMLIGKVSTRVWSDKNL